MDASKARDPLYVEKYLASSVGQRRSDISILRPSDVEVVYFVAGGLQQKLPEKIGVQLSRLPGVQKVSVQLNVTSILLAGEPANA